jgi:hypothetical protein
VNCRFDPVAAFDRTVTAEQEARVVERVYHLEEEFDDDWADIADACAVKWDARLGPDLPDRALDLLVDAEERDVLPGFPPAGVTGRHAATSHWRCSGSA